MWFGSNLEGGFFVLFCFVFNFSGKVKGRRNYLQPRYFSHFFLAQFICYKNYIRRHKPEGNVLNALLSWVITGMAILYLWGKREKILCGFTLLLLLAQQPCISFLSSQSLLL